MQILNVELTSFLGNFSRNSGTTLPLSNSWSEDQVKASFLPFLGHDSRRSEKSEMFGSSWHLGIPIWLCGKLECLLPL